VSVAEDKHASKAVPEDSPAQTRKGLLELYDQRRELRILTRELQRIAGHCSLPPDVLALVPTQWEVITSPVRRLSDSVRAFAAKIDQEKTDFESHFRDNRKRAAACAREIAHTIDPDDEAVAYDFAIACLKAHRTAIAYEILERLADKADGSSKYVSSAKRRIARQAWNAGNADRAVMLMRSVRGRSARDQYRTWLSMLTIRNGLLIADSGNPAGAQDILKGALSASGMDQNTADAVTGVYMHATSRTPRTEQLPSAPRPAAAPDKFDVPRPVILSGFGWSGSGAVADFLKGHSSVTEAFSGRELGLWTGKYGLDRLYGHFVTIGFNRRLLLEFLTRHCFGHVFLGGSKGTKSAGGMWAWLNECQRWELLGALSRWLTGIHQWIEQPDYPVLDTFKSLSTEFLRLLSAEGSNYVLLSNCIPSNSITGVRVFYEPVVIVSWRNPADAYVSKKAAFPDLSAGVVGWQEQLTTRIDQYLTGKKEVIDHASIWLDVWFEDFVQDATSRQQLLDLLALDGNSMRSTFDPEVSAQNIGIPATETDTNTAEWSAMSEHVVEARRTAAELSRKSGADLTTIRNFQT